MEQHDVAASVDGKAAACGPSPRCRAAGNPTRCANLASVRLGDGDLRLREDDVVALLKPHKRLPSGEARKGRTRVHTTRDAQTRETEE